MNAKVLLVGWDAADWKLIRPLMERGLMPTTARLVDEGVSADLLTLSPILSPMLWTSIATGKAPYKHGIHGFTEPMPSGIGARPVTSRSRTTKALWNILSQSGLRSNVVGWWPSNPAEPINGTMVSNLYQSSSGPIGNAWPLKAGSVHPPRLFDQLADLRIHPEDITGDELRAFLPKGERIDQSTDGRLYSCAKIIAECASIQACAMHLIQNEPWDFMAVYFDGIDHFCHGFMRYHPPKVDWISEADYEIYQNVVTAGYVFHDMMLGHLLQHTDEDTTVLIVSDHGFHPDHMRRKQLPNEPAGPAIEHREHGILLAHGPRLRKDTLIHGANLLDVTPTILTLLGLPLGDDMDGRPLVDMFSAPPEVKTIPSWDEVDGDAGMLDPDTDEDVENEAEGMEQLVALGYIDRPDNDGRKAAQRALEENKFNLAKSYIHGGLHGEAVPLLVELYKERPLEFRFGIQLALCLKALDRIDDLARVVTDLRSRWQRASERARQHLADIADIANERRARLRRLGNEHDTVTLESVRDRLFTKEERDVIRDLRTISKGNPHTLDYLDGWVAMGRKDYQLALAAFSKANVGDGVGTGHLFQMAEAYRQLLRSNEAVECYQKVLALDPHDANAYLGLARVHAGTFDFAQAEAAARQALTLNFKSAGAHFILGVCLKEKGNLEQAAQEITLAIEQNPNYPEAYEQLARLHREQGQDSRANELASFGKALRKARTLMKPADIDALPDFTEIDFDIELPQFPISKVLPRLGDPATEESAKPGQTNAIVIVAGLPRSGTSMLMQMVEACGIPIATDDARKADENNPKGYLEFERVKSLYKDNSWVGELRGKCCKVITPLLPFLPQNENYRVIFIERNINEVVSSQRKMLDRSDEAGAQLSDGQLSQFLTAQNDAAQKILSDKGVAVLQLSHASVLSDPLDAARSIGHFLGVTDEQTIRIMSETVDSKLHRERSTFEARSNVSVAE